jgi:hypothetical protein
MKPGNETQFSPKWSQVPIIVQGTRAPLPKPRKGPDGRMGSPHMRGDKRVVWMSVPSVQT